jgi:hypothetical protein
MLTVEELMIALEDYGEHLTVVVEHGPTERKFHIDHVDYGNTPDGGEAVIIRVTKVVQGG